VTVLYTGS